MTDPVRIPIERELDLHPFAPRDIPSVVEEYVNAAHEAGLREIRLVHGRGRGVQRAIVQQTLDRHPLVVPMEQPREREVVRQRQRVEPVRRDPQPREVRRHRRRVAAAEPAGLAAG